MTARTRILLATALVAAAPAALRAQTPTAPPTIEACYVPASGTIYRINTQASPAPGAPAACLSATHVRFTWNQQGAKGDPGAPGAAGAHGEKGDKGEKGDPGPQGAAGPQGIQGLRGPQGVAGQQGPIGPQGLKGDTGPAATSGYEREVFGPFNVQHNVFTTATAVCSPGKKVVGGGFEVVGGATSAQAKLDIKESYPPSTTQWRVVVLNLASMDFSANVYALCI